MFLKELDESESIAFINLVKELALIDDSFAKEEQNLINDYLVELHLTEDKVIKMNYHEVIDKMKTLTSRKKEIIYFELVGLALVDGQYGEKEVEFLDKIAIDLDIRRGKKRLFLQYFYNFKQIYDFTTVEADNKIQLLKEEAEALL